MARGMKGDSLEVGKPSVNSAPPVIQSIIGAEIGGKTLQGGGDSPTPYKALLVVRDNRNTLDPAPALAASEARTVSVEIGRRIQQIRSEKLSQQTGQAASRAARQQAGSGGLLEETPGAPAQPNKPPLRLADTTARIQAGAQTIATSESAAKESRELEDKYRQVVQGVLVIAAIKAASQTVNNYTPDMVTQATVKDVVQTVLGASNAHVPPEVLQALGSMTLGDVANAPYKVVAQAIGQYAQGRLNNQLATLDGQLTGMITTTGTTVARNVNQMQRQVEDVSTMLGDFSKAIQHETDALTGQTVAVTPGKSADLIVMRPEDDALWAQLSPREKLAALDEGAFASSDVDIASLKQSLVQTAQVLDARDKALGALSQVGQLGALAASLGVPIDTYNLTKNIDTASTAINVAASIATGNWVGALSSAAGLIGGGPGPSPEQMQLSRISQQLNQVIDLQKQTLENLNKLSKQLEESTAKVLEQLANVQRMVASVIAFEQQAEQAKFLQCENFVLTATREKYQMVNGLFPSFEARRQHFLALGMPEAYSECRNYLDSVKDVKSGAGGQPYLNTIFVSQLANGPADTSPADLYQSMLNHTIHLLGADSLAGAKPNCLKRMAWAASLGARYFSDVNFGELSCGKLQDPDITAESLRCTNTGDGVDGKECQKLRFTDTNEGEGLVEVPFAHALGLSIVPENVQEIGEMLLFVTPYETFLKRDKAQVKILRPSDLAKDVLDGPDDGRPENTALYIWPNAFLNVVNMAIAQQSIAAGEIAVDGTARLLQTSHYGSAAAFPAADSATDPNLKSDQPARAAAWLKAMGDFKGGSVGPDFPEVYNYVATLLLLQNNPAYAVNVMRFLVTKRLFGNNVSRPEYALALQSADAKLIGEMLKDVSSNDYLPLEYLTKGGKGWHLVLRMPNGSSYYLPLPSVTAIWANSIAYPPGASGLFTLRDALLDRYLMSAPVPLQRVYDVQPSAQWLLRQEALTDRLLGSTRLTLSNYQTRAGPYEARGKVCVSGQCRQLKADVKPAALPVQHLFRAQ
jgi:hypothetical protein